MKPAKPVNNFTTKPKGGRGDKAPYETKLMRVPEPLASQVESLCQRYQDFLASGGNPIEPPSFLRDLPKATEQLQTELSNLKIEHEASPAEPETQPIVVTIADDCPIEPSNDSVDFRKLFERIRKATPDNIKELAEKLIKDAQTAITDKDIRKAKNIARELLNDSRLVPIETCISQYSGELYHLWNAKYGRIPTKNNRIILLPKHTNI